MILFNINNYISTSNQNITHMYSGDTSATLMDKVELILDSPSERIKYKSIQKDADRVSFFSNHFIMDDMSVRLLKRKYLLSEKNRKEFLEVVDELIWKLEL